MIGIVEGNKIGKMISISEDAYYRGQDMSWTEEMSEQLTLEEDMEVYHNSRWSFIESFFPKEICCCTSLLKGEGHFYAILLPKGTVITHDAGENPYTHRAEVRVNLSENENIKIQYIGNMEEISSEIKGNFRYAKYRDNTIVPNFK
ncbi:hypothetical protein ES705_42621 [subsurface metagenome]